jgi:hypothetical protein
LVSAAWAIGAAAKNRKKEAAEAKQKRLEAEAENARKQQAQLEKIAKEKQTKQAKIEAVEAKKRQLELEEMARLAVMEAIEVESDVPIEKVESGSSSSSSSPEEPPEEVPKVRYRGNPHRPPPQSLTKPHHLMRHDAHQKHAQHHRQRVAENRVGAAGSKAGSSKGSAGGAGSGRSRSSSVSIVGSKDGSSPGSPSRVSGNRNSSGPSSPSFISNRRSLRDGSHSLSPHGRGENQNTVKLNPNKDSNASLIKKQDAELYQSLAIHKNLAKNASTLRLLDPASVKLTAKRPPKNAAKKTVVTPRLGNRGVNWAEKLQLHVKRDDNGKRDDNVKRDDNAKRDDNVKRDDNLKRDDNVKRDDAKRESRVQYVRCENAIGGTTVNTAKDAGAEEIKHVPVNKNNNQNSSRPQHNSDEPAPADKTGNRQRSPPSSPRQHKEDHNGSRAGSKSSSKNHCSRSSSKKPKTVEVKLWE